MNDNDPLPESKQQILHVLCSDDECFTYTSSLVDIQRQLNRKLCSYDENLGSIMEQALR